MIDRSIPLPYIVGVRRTFSEDDAPDITEHKVIAYSISEAMYQAVFAAGGSEINAGKFVVESIGPDLDRFYKMQSELKK